MESPVSMEAEMESIMPNKGKIAINDEVQAALEAHKPVVALESTAIAQGLPRPVNLETARALEQAVRDEGAIPATVGVYKGIPTVGLDDQQIQYFATNDDVIKASRRDIGVAVAQEKTAATTVAATMFLAHQVGIQIFATGGIGGAHRSTGQPWDISADLIELGRTPVAVICAGAKSILDIPRTLEILETNSVPVLGHQTEEFPAFYLASSGEPVSARVDSVEEIASVLRAHWNLGQAGIVIAQPIAEDMALDETEVEKAVEEAENVALKLGVRGNALTPFLLSSMSGSTGGRALKANCALLLANARLAAQVANALVPMNSRR
ncbi:MAG: pseudouridine-5'-phosphate glycosidase [Gemmataceae bacterium]